ncbi:MAG: histidine kinase [Acidobacteria bacterium]|nr:histidine kinase [Acidobacteriota bacterium]
MSIIFKTRVLEKLKSRTAIHAFCWVGLFLLMAADNLLDPLHLFHAAVYVLLAMLPVYAHFLAIDHLFLARRRLLYAGVLGLIIVAGGALDYLVLSNLSPSKATPLTYMMMVLVLLVITTGLKFGARGIRRELDLRELQTRHARTELALLKSQIHPHFLFNTLNNLFALARKEPGERTADGISRLADLMRYMIYETDVERIELAREVEQIRSFMALQELRFAPEDDIRFELQVTGDVANARIAPMLLMPFVENAFKHSVSLQQPVRVRMELDARGDTVRFAVRNTVNRRRRTDDGPGLGLANVRRRLELLYPGKHSLETVEGEDEFAVTLVVRDGER